MKRFALCALTLIAISCNEAAPEVDVVDTPIDSVVTEEVVDHSAYIAEIQAHRDEKDSEFIDPEKTSLTEEGRQVFEGLPYYEVDPAYLVKGTLKRLPGGEIFEMETSTDRRPEYIRYGVFTGELNGASITLEVYRQVALISNPLYRESLFVPFVDATTGNETYGSGRYIEFDLESIDDALITEHEVTLDFNLCFSPYCSYNPKYSCPIPPSANHLSIAIEAGEKKWEGPH